MKLNRYTHIYLIGIGGIGMSALARYFNKKEGINIFGYDKNRSELCIKLESEGIKISYNELLDEKINKLKELKNKTLVIYTPAINSDNVILKYFRKHNFDIMKRSEVLGCISQNIYTIAIAGTHGKTTTATILSHILYSCGKQLTAFFGGISKNYNSNLINMKNSELLVVEADEYDKSFLEINADIAIITSLDADHLDVYKNKNNFYKAFIQFSKQIKKEGVLLVEKSISNIFSAPKNGIKLTYSAVEKADYYCKNIFYSEGNTHYNFFNNYVKSPTSLITCALPGLHNISNSIAAISIASFLGIKMHDISSAMLCFKGISRRFDIQINKKNIAYIDDYAHHPKEVSETIKTAKNYFPNREITVVFQPHLFSRTNDFASDFALSLSLANNIILLNIYPAREKPIKGVDSEMLLNLCTSKNKEICKKENLIKLLEKKDIDVLLTLGAGDISTLVKPIKHLLN